MLIAKPVFVLPLAAALMLTACTTTGPRQNTGAAAGAVAGGLLGGIVSGRPAGAAIGAVGGALVGGAIGQQLDKQAGELRAGFDDGRISVVNTGNSLVVTMPEAILFATDSSQLTPAIRKNLRVLADHLNKYPSSNVQVIGHTDNQGAASYNLNLSRQRAASVTQVLLNNGVAAYRVTSIGRGEDQPIASNLTPEGRAQNRRVEIVIIPTS
ncbi:MAG: OmpA family protein [Maritimibacter sp.]|nr:OmpA family protein [Maritimibacter sp.]